MSPCVRVWVPRLCPACFHAAPLPDTQQCAGLVHAGCACRPDGAVVPRVDNFARGAVPSLIGRAPERHAQRRSAPRRASYQGRVTSERRNFEATRRRGHSALEQRSVRATRRRSHSALEQRSVRVYQHGSNAVQPSSIATQRLCLLPSDLFYNN